MAEKHDVVIAGGGHHGLIAACYLAKAGLKVCIAERRAAAAAGLGANRRTPTRRVKGMRFAAAGGCRT